MLQFKLRKQNFDHGMDERNFFRYDSQHRCDSSINYEFHSFVLLIQRAAFLHSQMVLFK